MNPMELSYLKGLLGGIGGKKPPADRFAEMVRNENPPGDTPNKPGASRKVQDDQFSDDRGTIQNL